MLLLLNLQSLFIQQTKSMCINFIIIFRKVNAFLKSLYIINIILLQLTING